jgi:hypothetical protein
MENPTNENTQTDNTDADPVITRGDGTTRSVPKRGGDAQPEHKVIAHDIKRELPVKLTNDQLLEVAFSKARLEDERDQLQDQFADVKREWGERIAGVEKHIDAMGVELRTRERRQVVLCHERVVAATRMVEVVREDTDEVVERRAANLFEVGKVLPPAKREETDATAEDPPEVDDALAAAANETLKAAAAANVEETEDGDVTVPDTAAPKKKRGRKS